MKTPVSDQTSDGPPACPDRTVASSISPSELRRGAVDDFDTVFVASYDGLVRSLATGFANRSRAEEAVQEAFVRAYSRWRRVSRLDDPVGWVRRVAINLLLDEIRRDDRQRRAGERLALLAPPVDPGPQDRQPADEMARAVATLPPQQRLAVALFYLDDLSVHDVAAAMSISEGAVKFHLHQARTALREHPALRAHRDAS